MRKSEIQRKLQEVLRTSPVRGYVRRISLFGSHLHGTARKDSDIDLLIELKEPISMLALVRMEREMSRALERPVELSTLKSLSKYFRSDIVNEAELLLEVAP